MAVNKISYSMLIRMFLITGALFLVVSMSSCTSEKKNRSSIEIYQSSSQGDSLRLVEEHDLEAEVWLELHPEVEFQIILGFGGAFTESSTHLLMNLSDSKREKILKSYFGKHGARYSMARVHMNSCDFSLHSYDYVETGDTSLESFSIEVDKDDIIPIIHEAKSYSSNGFDLISSPWTAPPCMKDNKDWFGGKLLPEFYDVWAEYFIRYIRAYEEEGIDLWGFTIENEPLGNGAHWESMHYTPEEMKVFVLDHLAPKLEAENLTHKLLVYDQNRGPELEHWSKELLSDTVLLDKIAGTAVHWYDGTVDWFPESLEMTYELAPDKLIINTEACVDNEVPHWKEDDWYWKKEATDWGYQWAPEKDKYRHPKYVPVYRYVRDIIGCLNNHVSAWIDWNMVLDKQGGPNHASNWCIAPIIVDTLSDEVYYTPLFNAMLHFSKFIDPGDLRIQMDIDDEALLGTAVKKESGEYVLVLLNMETGARNCGIRIGEEEYKFEIQAESVQSIRILL